MRAKSVRQMNSTSASKMNTTKTILVVLFIGFFNAVYCYKVNEAAFGLFFPFSNYVPTPSSTPSHKDNFVEPSTQGPHKGQYTTGFNEESVNYQSGDVETFDGKFAVPWSGHEQKVKKENYENSPYDRSRGYGYEGPEYSDYDSQANGCDHDFDAGDDEYYPYYRHYPHYHHRPYDSQFNFGNRRPSTKKATNRPTTAKVTNRPTVIVTERPSSTTPAVQRSTIPQIDIRIGNFKKRSAD
ncbi:uncharacterized protein [Euwallacea fornicatus]|uniref:uncharacterized protein isoform X2 n=1 Tax=Euwallacea fornicatus TaxID=995702 RepID=UPI00338DEF66